MSFDIAINRLLGNEGGYVNNPADPGGETNWGISKRAYPNLNIQTLTREQAIALYHRDFWEIINADTLPDSLGYQLLDFAVNSGSSTAIRALQRAIGVADDGYMGPVSLAKLKTIEAHDLIMRFLAQRLRFMTKCKGWSDFGKGWANRIATNLEYGAEDA